MINHSINIANNSLTSDASGGFKNIFRYFKFELIKLTVAGILFIGMLIFAAHGSNMNLQGFISYLGAQIGF